MGGGKLDINFAAGPLYAYFTAYADFFIVWSPFYFTADVGITAGAGFRGKWGPIDVDISVHVGAKLHLKGPPFSGYVDIDVIVTTIRIHFGDPPDEPKRLSLTEFWDLLSGDTHSDDGGITLAIDTGSIPGGKSIVEADSAKQVWTVSPNGFSFLVQCRFALQAVNYDEKQAIPDGDKRLDVLSRPMQSRSSITSILNVKVTRKLDSKVEETFTCKPISKNAPLAHWKSGGFLLQG